MQINKEPEYETVKKTLKKNQKDWVKHFNNQKLKMISTPDIYNAAKKGNKTIIESLKKDFKESWEVTSTRIKYNKKNLNAEITHDAESNIIKQNKYKIEIPILEGDFKQDSQTERYLQALFDTKDNISIILKTLKKFGKNRTIRFWTPTQSQRESKQIRSVDLFFGGFDGFCVCGVSWFVIYFGLSRGVIINSAKQSKSK